MTITKRTEEIKNLAKELIGTPYGTVEKNKDLQVISARIPRSMYLELRQILTNNNKKPNKPQNITEFVVQALEIALEKKEND